MPARIFISVDFPAPFSPINATTSPRLASSETASKAFTPGNDFEIAVNDSMRGRIIATKGDRNTRSTRDTRRGKLFLCLLCFLCSGAPFECLPANLPCALHELQKLAAVAVAIWAHAVLRHAEHGIHCCCSFVRRIAQDHPE